MMGRIIDSTFPIMQALAPCPIEGRLSVGQRACPSPHSLWLILFLYAQQRMSTKIFFRTEPLRGRIQVEIDGFFYYVELYKSEE